MRNPNDYLYLGQGERSEFTSEAIEAAKSRGWPMLIGSYC